MSFLLHQSRFFTTVNHLRDLPATAQPEIAFAGRSNAGKSTAINILCNQKRLAFASKTPGRTQHINYFSVGKADEPTAHLVDLPGYGYAEVPGAAEALVIRRPNAIADASSGTSRTMVYFVQSVVPSIFRSPMLSKAGLVLSKLSTRIQSPAQSATLSDLT